jgi:hypothetical protein
MANWENEWKQAKTAFESKTGQKKPSQKTVLGIRKGSGLEDALKTCDADFAAIGNEKKDMKKKAALIQKFENDIKTFDSKEHAYEKVLIAAIDKADEKLVKPELDILIKQLHALSATMKSHLKGATVALEEVSATEYTAKTLMTSVTGAVARAKLFAAKAGSAKDPKVFNTGIATAARDITQNIGNVEKLRTKGYVFPHGDPTNLFKVMTPWAQGNRKLPDNAAETLIKREIGAFLQAVAGVEKWAKT